MFNKTKLNKIEHLREKLHKQPKKLAKLPEKQPTEKSVKPTKKFRMASVESWAKEVLDRKPGPQLIEEIMPWEPGEYMAIAGRTGIGKTNLALYMAYCLATGTPFYGLKSQQINVAFFAFEGASTNMADRVKKIGRNFPKTKGHLRFHMMPIENPTFMFNNIWKKVKNCQVVFLDPVKYVVEGDYLKTTDVAAFIQLFRERLIAYELPAIITLPIRKPGNQKSLIHPGDVYSVKGATEYCDSATTVILLEKKEHTRSNEVKLQFAKNRISTIELSIIKLTLNRERCIFQSEELIGEVDPETIDEDEYPKIKYTPNSHLKKEGD